MRGLRVAAPLAACALALVSCGGSGAQNEAAAEEVGVAGLTGTPLRTFTCSDWNDAGAGTRLGTIEKLRNFAGGPVTGEGIAGRGAVLDDERAYDLLESRCRDPIAEHFLLYKLYTHAAGFAGIAP